MRQVEVSADVNAKRSERLVIVVLIGISALLYVKI